jgi:hypothetical protein
MVIASDPVDLKVPQLADLAVSLYLPGESGRPTSHGSALHPNSISNERDFTGPGAIADAVTSESYFWLAGVDVVAPSLMGGSLRAACPGTARPVV